MGAEKERLLESQRHEKHWERWGPYLAERAWANPREDYSANGDAWKYFPHDDARSRAYRWTEDGILGICDNHQRLCFAIALWNGRDPILKERLFGLSGPQGNHGEDVKEYYYYLDSTPTHSYMKGLYKYPQLEFPYKHLIEVNGGRNRSMPEYELIDTGIFDQNRYFDVFVEYAKADYNDILIRVTAINRGPDPALLHFLPTVWFRNTWSWGYTHAPRPALHRDDANRIVITDPTLGQYTFEFDGSPELLFTDNDTNVERLYHQPAAGAHFKDAFHDYIVDGRKDAVRPDATGSKACGWYRLDLAGGASRTLYFRLHENPGSAADFDGIFRPAHRGSGRVLQFRARSSVPRWPRRAAPGLRRPTVEQAVL